MKLKIKFIVAIIFSSIFSIIFFTTNDVQALTQEEAGQYIAEFSINFFNNYADQTIYSWNNEHRYRAYNDVKTSGKIGSGGELNGTPFENKYAMDCVGWVSFAIHHALGINSNIIEVKDGYSFSYFVVPINSKGTDTSIMEKVTGDLMPGDILVNSNHVMVYIGNNTIIDSAGSGIPTGAISKRTLAEYRQGYTLAYRIRSDVADKIKKSDATTIFKGSGGVTNKWSDSSSFSSSSVATQDGRIVDTDDKLPLFKHILLTEKYNFNNIKWKAYGHGYEGINSEMQEDLNLGLKYPKDESNNNLDKFINFVLPYLQNWMFPLGMNAGISTKGTSEDTSSNPMFTYTTIRKAMSDIIVNRYDVSTCNLTTRYREYDIIKITKTFTFDNSLENFTNLEPFVKTETVSEEVIQKGVKEPEEEISRITTVEPEYYIKQALTFDTKITNNLIYTKYNVSDVNNKVDNGVGFAGRQDKIGESINEIEEESSSKNGNVLTRTYYKKVGNYHYIYRTWRDEVRVETPKNEAYTYDDVVNYNKNQNTNNEENIKYSFDGTIYNCEKYNLSEENIKRLGKKVASENNSSTDGQAAIISEMVNRYEYLGKSNYLDVVDYVYNCNIYVADNNNEPTEETYALIRSIICEGKRTLPPYVTEMKSVSDIPNSLQVENYPTPVQGESKVTTSGIMHGIYWTHFENSGEGKVFYYSYDYKNKCIEENINVSEGTLENLATSTESSNTSSTTVETADDVEFNEVDQNYYKMYAASNEINKIDLMNSKPSEFLEYIAKGTAYSNHIGYSRAYLTFSYSTLKSLLREHFSDKNTLPFAYGTSLGYNTYNSSGNINSNSSAGSGNAALSFVRVALQEVGYLEKASNSQLEDKKANAGSNNWTKYGAWYGLNGGAKALWCNIFVSWCADQCGLLNTVIPKSAGCATTWAWYSSKGLTHLVTDTSYTPKTGDLVLRGPGDHIGIVEKYENGILYTIEGNTSGQGDVNEGNGVYQKKYENPAASWYGYCSPQYPTSAGTILGIGDLTGTGIDVGSALSSEAYTRAMQYFDSVTKYSEICGLDPYLVVAIIAQESAGRNVETKPAIGLMQWEKTNGQSITYTKADGTQEKIDFTFDQLRVDTDLQIRVGCAALKNKFDSYSGNVLVALQGYNYGAGGVKRCVCHYISGGQGSGKFFGVTDEKYKEYIKSNDTGWISSTSWYSSTGHTAFPGAGGGDPKYLSNVLRFYNKEEAQKLN